MVPLMSLWMPILLSAVVVFIASSVIHMALGYHRADFQGAPNDTVAQDALRSLNLAAGDYAIPRPPGSANMKDPAFVEKLERGPNVIMTVFPNGQMAMGALLGKWFAYLVVVSFFAAYVGSRALAPGTAYLAVFRIVGTVAFLSYAMGQWPAAIWYRKSVSTTIRNTVDSLIYGLLTGGVFGWLWPM